MSKNTVIVTILSVSLIFGFLFLVYRLSNQTSVESQKVIPAMMQIKPDDHIKWAKQGKAILVEYSDLQCPACKTYHSVLKPFDATGSAEFELAKQITFVYRHFPLVQIHKNAYAAAHAAEAAGKQGRFFEMTDLMFENQDVWSEKANPKEIFIGFAKQLKLDLKVFEKDMSSQEVREKVNADLVSGRGAEVSSTPTFFLNGQRIEIRSFDEFKALLRDAAK